MASYLVHYNYNVSRSDLNIHSKIFLTATAECRLFVAVVLKTVFVQLFKV